MDNEFSILEDYWMQMFMINLKASDALYHLLGGKESHKVIRCQHRCNGWGWGDEYGEIISHEMLAKDQFGLNHAMTIRFIDDLSELEDIKEHPLGDVWEYQENGKDYFCRPATHMMVYFVNDTLPEDKLVCRVGFLLASDDLDINMDYPTQIISTVTDDGSDLAKLVRYLGSPSRSCNEFGALSRMVNVLLNIWENRKQTEGMA
jgi:hypothetical protein